MRCLGRRSWLSGGGGWFKSARESGPGATAGSARSPGLVLELVLVLVLAGESLAYSFQTRRQLVHLRYNCKDGWTGSETYNTVDWIQTP